MVAGSIALAALVAGGGLYLLLGRTRPPPGEEPAPRASPSRPGPSRPALVAAPLPAPPPLPPPAPPDAAAVVSHAVSAAIRKRDLLVAAHVQQVIQEADEHVFARLAISEDQRVAIRLLNERHAQRTQRDLAEQRDDLLPEQQFGNTIALTENGERARRAELVQLLGSAAADSLLRAETAEVRRLQRRYRVQWAEELDQNVPLPPGLPARAH
jgi:hypothetical protein